MNIKTFKDEMIPECPYTLKNADKIKKEFDVNPDETRAKYPKVFYYHDGMVGTIVNQSMHAAGMVISPITLDDNYGVFNYDGETCLLLDMEEAHSVGMCKYDFLILTNIKIIADVYKAIGKPFPKTHEIDWNNQAVWQDMRRSPYGIFQAESSFFTNSLKKMKPTNMEEMSMLTAAVRPSGASYRDKLFAREPNKNPTKEMDEVFADTWGWCLYQEQITAALMKLCGFSGGEADIVRRDIAKKKPEAIKRDIIKIKEGYCKVHNKSQEEAEREVTDFIQVIDDASGYSFGYNHALSYCLLSYLCAYCRYHYPLEFCTAYLNGAASQSDIYNGTTLAQTYGINIEMPTWGHTGEEYTFDKATNTIYQGLASVKSLTNGLGATMHDIEQAINPTSFTDLLLCLKAEHIGDKQIEILISIGYFKKFGNPTELQKILENSIKLKYGGLVWLSEEKREAMFGKDEGEISLYAERRTEKNWKVMDGASLLRYMERCIKAKKLPPPPMKDNIATWMEYIGYTPALGPDYRAMMYVTTPPKTLTSRRTGKPWAYSIMAISLRTADMHEWTIPKGFYVHTLKQGDVIRVVGGKSAYKAEEYEGMTRYTLYNYCIANNI